MYMDKRTETSVKARCGPNLNAVSARSSVFSKFGPSKNLWSIKQTPFTKFSVSRLLHCCMYIKRKGVPDMLKVLVRSSACDVLHFYDGSSTASGTPLHEKDLCGQTLCFAAAKR